MRGRTVLFAAALLLSATSAAAEPAKTPNRPAAQPQAAPAQVMLASADDLRTPPPSDQQAQTRPKPPRIARVTTCRCGDPQAQPEQ
jgi:hypothetical protein